MSVTGWILFHVLILGMILIDLYLYEGGDDEKQWNYALIWSLVWIGAGLAFGGVIYQYYGYSGMIDYYTGYVLEKSLSMDNIFVFLLVFAHFCIPNEHQHRVLFWGVLSALVMRLLFIVLGVALLSHFEWLFYLFGIILIYSGGKMVFTGEEDRERELEESYFVGLVRNYLPMTQTLHGEKFFVRKNGQLVATPLVLVLVVIELSDIMFAIDSVPAILSITKATFIVYASNAFAILGLRALYFLLAGMVEKFRYLDNGIALILVFVGVKMLSMHYVHIPNLLSLGIILSILVGSIVLSWILASASSTNGPSPSAS